MPQPPESAALPGFDEAPAAAAAWVDGLRESLGWQDRGRAFTALIATLHALRDHLPADEVAFLGAELPVLLRGLYYEGWHPRARQLPFDDRESFLMRVHEALHREPGIDPEQVVRAVLALLSERITAPELEEVRAATPAPLHGMWPV